MTSWLARTALVAALAVAAAHLPARAADAKLKVDDRPLNREARGVSYAPVIKRVSPSVVNIYSSKVIRSQPFNHPGLDDPIMRWFFGDQMERQQRRPPSRRAQNLGSGVIVSEDGYILTNNHVVEGADKVEVALPDGKATYTAKIIATDPQTDVAVLKVEASKLPAITLADSDQVEVGDVVLAIGNPFNLGQTVTMGIVSATGKAGFNLVDYEDFIQTDAAINPGNSGGALVDAEGRLVGINTWIFSRSGGNQGVGFAIPVNLARMVLERVDSDGKVRRGFMGLLPQPLDAELAKEFKVPGGAGALVGEVTPNTPAAAAGLKEGDVITEFNGKKVTDDRHFRLLVAATPPKTKATVKFYRDGREKSATVTLAERPGDLSALERGTSGPESNQQDVLDGIEVDSINSKTRRQFNLPSDLSGAVVTRVDEDSPAWEAGLRPGDVIVEINRQPVADADAAVALSEKSKGDRALLRVWSNGVKRYLSVGSRSGK